jgi:hypothetical protein
MSIEPQDLKLWDKELPVSLENAWLTSRKGYYYALSDGQKLFDIGKDEWRMIGSYPPQVTLSDYMKIRKMNEQQLRTAIPGGIEVLRNVFVASTKQDLFFYLTRFFLPNQPDMRERVDRLISYRSLTDYNKLLIKQLYGSERAFYSALEIRPLEKMVFAYDKYLSDPEILNAMLVELDVEYSEEESIYTFVYRVLEKRIAEFLK